MNIIYFSNTRKKEIYTLKFDIITKVFKHISIATAAYASVEVEVPNLYILITRIILYRV